MEKQAFPTNETSILHTDYYCGNMTAGPLIWAVISGPLVCVGVPASVWLLWVLIQRQRQGLTNDIYMFNLTIMDLMSNSNTVACILSFFIWQNDFISRTCDFTHSLSLIGRPMFMTCICVDCYVAVVHPISYMKTKDSRRKVTVCKLVCVLVWCLTIATGIVFAVKPELMSTPIAEIPLALTAPAIIVLDFAILRTLRKPDPSGRRSVHPQKQRALQTITNSLVMTLVSYLPSLVINIFSPLMSLTPQEMSCYVLFPSTINFVLASVIMPLLFLENLGTFTRLKWCGCPREE